jgi:hypothetical protein
VAAEFADATYLLPIRTSNAVHDTELTAYLRDVANWLDVVIVDGSEAAVFAVHAAAWGRFVTHLGVRSSTRNGKVAGVLDGISASSTPRIVIADDDVRYDYAAITAVLARLEHFDAVIPQNVFAPTPWHAHWDTARTLVNRSFGSDYAGTIALRAEAVRRTRGYCGAVLFENLELLRTLEENGARICRAGDIYVERRPPRLPQFFDQRVRQAYDSRAQPVRRMIELGILPALLLSGKRWRRLPAAIAVGSIMLAELGRRRQEGARRFPAHAALWAPFWVAERAVCAWLSEVAAHRGGVRYASSRLRTAAHPRRLLRTSTCPEKRCTCETPWRGQPEREGVIDEYITA